MKMSEDMKNRLQRDRPMETISIRMPQDVIEDLRIPWLQCLASPDISRFLRLMWGKG